MEIYKINVTEKQVKILNAVERYINKHPFCKEVGQSDEAIEDGTKLVCELADIYYKYNLDEI